MLTSPLHGLHEGRPQGARGAVQQCKSGDQLGLELLGFSRIADGSRERNTRPLATAVFDF